MTSVISFDGPNGEEIEFWNGPQGQNWVKQNDLTDLMYDPFGDAALKRAALSSGDQVLDVGCGCGKTTLKLAQQVGVGGHVTAVDVSAPMLNVARRRTPVATKNIAFTLADAESYAFEDATFDAVFSQFGLMFFRNPDTAFANLYRALKPGGHLTFVCWQRPERNPFLMIPFDAVHRFVPDMAIPSPDVPASPFSLAPREKLHHLLRDAGFTDGVLDEFQSPTRMGWGDLETCVAFVADFSNPVATALRRSESGAAAAILQAVRDAVAPYHTGQTLELPASAWIVSARRP